LLCVVISSLKFEMSCDTCVRCSPCSFAASGMDASCASVSRASLNACFAAAASTWVAWGCADVCAAGGCAGFCAVAGSVLCVAGVVDWVPLVDAGGCAVDVGGCELVVVVWDVGVCAGGWANAAAGTPSRAAAAIAVVQRDVEPFISQSS
jgi:hypothetical protein